MVNNYCCGFLNINDLGKNITLYGWVNNLRILKKIIFIDLRDRSGIIQIYINRNKFKLWKLAIKLTFESCIKISGILFIKKNNKNLLGNKFEICVENIYIFNYSKSLPLNIFIENSEKIKLKYRYLYLRRLDMFSILKKRSEIKFLVRKFLHKNNFIDIETPFLSKSFLEGANDYIIPSKEYKGKKYSLPQSPQIFKQLLMISGFEKYYQIVKCFRDEDLRSDRQPEFTQIDIELSFSKFNDIKFLIEKLICKLWFDINNIKLSYPFFKIDYYDAINNYGTDKPDLRNPLKFNIKISNFFKNIYSNFIKEKKICNVISILISNSSNKINFNFLFNYLKLFKINNFFCVRVVSFIKGKYIYEIYGNILDIKDDLIQEIIIKHNISLCSLIFVMFCFSILNFNELTDIRNFFCRNFSFFNKDVFFPLWIVNFPMFFYDKNKKINVYHHPFTMPLNTNLKKLKSIVDYTSLISSAYDLVINGYEVGSGSVRICDSEIQFEIFKILGLNYIECINKYGFFLNALNYGTPPHLGIALGLDRIVMLLTGVNNIKDVIAFPKTTSGLCLLTGAPD